MTAAMAARPTRGKTPAPARRYDERLEQIGRDLLWVFSALQKLQKA
jgi:hypothetical protein